jgi:uncharacterized delta-60 repeat protein
MKFTLFKNQCLKNCSRRFCLTVQPKVFALALLIITIFFAGDGRAASPGALDLSFGLRGTSTYDLGIQFFMRSYAVVIQPDGKVVLAGYIRICSGSTCNISFLVVRYNTDGTLDNSFDTDGAAVADFLGHDESAYAAAVQMDGKIVVAGGSLGGTPSQTNVYGFKITRFLQDGTLDTTFGTGGKVYEAFDDLGGTPQTMIIQPDGKIVVAGTDDNSMLFVARFNSDGNVDTGFATNGRFASNAYNVSLTRLARQSDGKIIIAATKSGSSDLRLIRFNVNGTPDNSFGSSGVVTSTFTGGFTPTIAVQTDDKMLVSAQTL